MHLGVDDAAQQFREEHHILASMVCGVKEHILCVGLFKTYANRLRIDREPRAFWQACNDLVSAMPRFWARRNIGEVDSYATCKSADSGRDVQRFESIPA